MTQRIKAWLLRALCGHEKCKQINEDDLTSFAFLRYDRIGDLIVSLPLVKALKNHFPHASLTIIASESNAPVAEYSGLFSSIEIRNTNVVAWIYQLWSMRKRFDVVVDLNHSVAPHAIFAILVLNPKHVASPFKEGRWGVKGSELRRFNIMPRVSPKALHRPISEIYLDIARLLSCDPVNTTPYPLDPNFLEHQTNRTIILNHRSSRPNMRLPDDHLLEIVRSIKRIRPSYSILMFPENTDFYIIKKLMKDQTNVEVMQPTPTIVPVIEAIKVAALVITPDTALVHIASAFSKPLIAVYANEPTLFTQWKPLNAAPTITIFSAHNKSLEGYDSQYLSLAVKELAEKLPD